MNLYELLDSGGGDYLTLAASRKHKSICLHCGQRKLDLNDVCEIGIAFCSSVVRMLIATSRPTRISYAPARGRGLHNFYDTYISLHTMHAYFYFDVEET